MCYLVFKGQLCGPEFSSHSQLKMRGPLDEFLVRSKDLRGLQLSQLRTILKVSVRFIAVTLVSIFYATYSYGENNWLIGLGRLKQPMTKGGLT